MMLMEIMMDVENINLGEIVNFKGSQTAGCECVCEVKCEDVDKSNVNQSQTELCNSDEDCECEVKCSDCSCDGGEK